MKTVVKIKFGSHLYGTNTPESDTDYKSVHIPDARDILLGTATGEIQLSGRAKAEGEKNTPGDVDDKSYSLKKFFDLLADGQTVAIDMLFAPEPEVTSGLWGWIQKHHKSFISNRSAAFVGYCRTQANKYGIKGSRVAAARDAAYFFQYAYTSGGATEKVGDHLPALKATVIHNNPEHCKITEYVDVRDLRRNSKYFECCNKLVPVTASVKLAAEIFTKIHDGYGASAQLAATNKGINWKALSHAVRVGTEALELMSTGKVTFPLPNREHVLAIKQGKISYNYVAKEIEELLEKVTVAEQYSILPAKPDKRFMDNIVFDAYRQAVVEEFYGTFVLDK